MKTRAVSTLIKLINETHEAWRKAEPWEENDLHEKGMNLADELYRAALGPYHAKIKFPMRMREDVKQTIMNHSSRITAEQAESVLWVFMEEKEDRP